MKVINNCSAIILCGGKSSRMGFDKALLKINGEYVLKTLAEKLSQVFEKVILVADNKEKLNVINDLSKFNIVDDNYPNCGPLGAIVTGIINNTMDYSFVTACDMPSVDFDLINKMFDQIDDKNGIMCQIDGFREPMFAFYHKSCLDLFTSQLEIGQLGIQKVSKQLDFAMCSLSDKEKYVFETNLNTLTDLNVYNKKDLEQLRKFKITRYENGKLFKTTDVTVREFKTDIIINDKLFLSVMATPELLEDLAIGMLFSENIINSIEEVKSIYISEDLLEVCVNIANENWSYSKSVRVSGFGGGLVSENFLNQTNYLNNETRISCKEIVNLMNNFSGKSDLFQQTGAVHSCCLCLNFGNDQNLIFAEDVGRHNALDKVIGNGLRNKLQLSQGILLTTGRISTEILLKTARAGISILVSKSPPTDRAVETAKTIGMTLIGFARGNRFNIYSGEERLV